MRYSTGIFAGCGALTLLVTPAWAHQSGNFPVHGDALVPMLVLAAAVGALLALRRSRSRAG